MPWRGPEVEGEFPTLGYAVAEVIQASCAIPDGSNMGRPFVLTDEQLLFLLHHYRIDPVSGRFVHFRGSQLTRPQKWGKGPFAAAIICAEAHPEGPVVFDGWDAAGEPVGKPWPTPHIQATAVSEDQVDNVFRALLPMIQLGALAGDIPDTGLTRINLPGGGLIEPVTASARSRLGQRVTFVVQDQTESWVAANGGHALADNQRRGLAGMGGRWLSTPNAWDPVEDSVAQRTGESKAPGVYLDDVDPGTGSVRNKAERRQMLKRVYGNAATAPSGSEWVPWIDLDRIDGEIEALLEYDPAQAERWFLNRKLASEGAAFDFEAWKAKARPRRVKPGETIVLGIDGALYDDALAVVAAEVKTGYVWPVGIWERPKDARDDYEHPLHEVDSAVRDTFETFNVWRAYADPQHIRSLIIGWQNTYGDKRVADWPTYRPRQIGPAVREFQQAITRAKSDDGKGTGSPPLSHSGDPTLTRHIQNSRRRKLPADDDRQKPFVTLAKQAQHSPHKIDGAMAAVLAWVALGDAIEAGAVWMGESPAATPDPPEPARYKPGSAPSLSDLSLAGHGAGHGDLS